MRLTYSVIICTRNRPSALALCLRHLAAQTVRPSQVIVIDSSDHMMTTHRALIDSPIPYTYRHTVPGLCAQRNAGLALVTEPIVLFPDDDSILYPECAAHMISAYANPKVSAACAYEAADSPPNSGIDPRRKTWRDRVRTRLSNLRRHIETYLIPNSVNLIGAANRTAQPHPQTVETMTGFRMSFRTSVIKTFGFDTTLSPYASYEDRDASLSAWRHGLVVAAPGALIYHHRAPERRANGRRLGVCNLLNLAYVTAKHGDARAKQAARLFVRYQTLLYALMAWRGKHEWERFKGAYQAITMCDWVLAAKPDDIGPKHGYAVRELLALPYPYTHLALQRTQS